MRLLYLPVNSVLLVYLDNSLNIQAWLVCPAMSGPASLTVIVLSCKVWPCQFVRHFPVLQCQALQIRLSVIVLSCNFSQPSATSPVALPSAMSSTSHHVHRLYRYSQQLHWLSFEARISYELFTRVSCRPQNCTSLSHRTLTAVNCALMYVFDLHPEATSLYYASTVALRTSFFYRCIIFLELSTYRHLYLYHSYTVPIQAYYISAPQSSGCAAPQPVRRI